MYNRKYTFAFISRITCFLSLLTKLNAKKIRMITHNVLKLVSAVLKYWFSMGLNIFSKKANLHLKLCLNSQTYENTCFFLILLKHTMPGCAFELYFNFKPLQ